MRVWTLHPKYLDRKELMTCWGEGLKALKILSHPRTYKRFYPGLSVFRMQSEPVYVLVRYLQEIAKEGKRRGLDMDISGLPKVPVDFRLKIPVSPQRLEIERKRLVGRLARISKWHVHEFETMRAGRMHPLFFLHSDNRPGAWEAISRIRLNR